MSKPRDMLKWFLSVPSIYTVRWLCLCVDDMALGQNNPILYNAFNYYNTQSLIAALTNR